MSNIKNHLNVLSFGLAIGITWGLGIFILGISAWLLDWGVGLVNVFGSLYFGYHPTFWGSILGAIWGFIDGFIGGIVIAWIYNLFSGRSDDIIQS